MIRSQKQMSRRLVTTGLFMVLTLLLSTKSFAGGGGEIWAGIVGDMCLMQDFNKYQDSPLGQDLLADGGEGLRNTRGMQCFRTARWVPTKLCDDLMAAHKPKSLQRVYEAHQTEVESLKPAFDFLQKQIFSPTLLACPDLPIPSRGE